ncbi:MAG: type II secretion system protein GspD [Terriglobia bacterium]
MRLTPAILGFALLAGVPSAAAAELPVRAPQPRVELEGPARVVLKQLEQLFDVPLRVTDDVSRQTIRLRLRDADFATALRVAAHLAGAFWLVEPDGTVLVALDTPENRQRYQRPVTKTLSLPGRSPEELNEAVRLLREILDMRRLRADPRSKTLTLTDTPARLAVAEELIARLHDDPGEVLIELQLLEVDRDEAQRLGVRPPDQVVAVHLGAGALALREDDASSLLEIIQFLLDRDLLPRALTQVSAQSLLAAGALDPSQLGLTVPPFILVGGGGTTFALNLPGAELNIFRLARITQTWRRLTLRARSGQEATFFSGERFPVVFTTFSSIFIPVIVQELIAQGVFIPPVPAIRYEELGLRLTVTPRIHPEGEITLAFKIGQTALTGQEINGIPVLTNREIEQQLRLRDGETFLLSGLRSTTRQKTRTGNPGLGSAPVIGRLFRSDDDSTRETELILLITPHLIRLPALTILARRALYVGTEKDIAPVGPGAGRPARPQGQPLRPPTPPRPRQRPPQPRSPQPQPPRPPN